MRWQQYLSLSLVTAIGLVGCARQASKLAMDIDKKGDVEKVSYDPDKELNGSFGIRAATGGSGKVRGILDGSGYYGYSNMTMQIAPYLTPYASIVGHVIGTTLKQDSYATIWSQYCQFNPAYCYQNGGNTPFRVVITTAVSGTATNSAAARLYRVHLEQGNSYAGGGNQLSYFGGGSYAEAWTLGANNASTVLTAVLFPGSTISAYHAVSRATAALGLTVTMQVTPLGGSSQTPGSGSKNMSALLTQSQNLPSYYVSQFNSDTLTVTPSGGQSSVTAHVNAVGIAQQNICWYGGQNCWGTW